MKRGRKSEWNIKAVGKNTKGKSEQEKRPRKINVGPFFFIFLCPSPQLRLTRPIII